MRSPQRLSQKGGTTVMGLRGPAPKPSGIRLLEGNPAKRALPADEPKPLACAPDMPRYLDSQARREWKRLVPILLAMRVLTEADGAALGNLCLALSILVRAHKDMQKATQAGGSGLLMKVPSGYIQQSPLIGIINGQVEIINRISREFGLTPSSRMRLSAAPEPTMDALEAKLCG
jgi:P27 family predicted phage terminase small subunit